MSSLKPAAACGASWLAAATVAPAERAVAAARRTVLRARRAVVEVPGRGFAFFLVVTPVVSP
jgi:hypothetical protein